MAAELKLPVPAGEFTWDDLQVLPDELHHHYQLIEGQIVMSPSPSKIHQRVVGRLYRALDDAAGMDFETFVAPFDFVPDPGVSLQPDVLVTRRGTEEAARTVVPPVLVVEVLSPSGRITDRTTKRALYERFGVAHYWIVDPEVPSVLALVLGDDGAYTEAVPVTGVDLFAAGEPFAVQFTPAELVALIWILGRHAGGSWRVCPRSRAQITEVRDTMAACYRAVADTEAA